MPRIVDHANRQRQLLDGAFPLFARHGYSALSMRSLAAKLGVSTGVLYHYFDGKQAIFVATVHQRVEHQLQRSQAALGRLDASQRLPALLAFVQAELDELSDTLRVALDFRRQDAQAGPFIQTVLGRYEDALRTHYGVSAQRAPVVLSVALGLLTHRLLDPTGVDLDQHIAVLALIAGEPGSAVSAVSSAATD